MELRIINPAEVIDLLPMAECIEVVDKAMRCASQGDAQMPLRKMLELPGENNLFGWMPGSMTEPDVFGTKLVSVFPGNFDLGMHSHHGIVALFESERGRPYAIVDASEITAIRTAAASALATRLLAREDSKTLAIMGYGAQARQHVESMLCVRDFDDIRVWGRNLEKSQAFAEDMGAKFGVEIQALENARAAVAEADVICTVTASREPVLFGDWLEPGQHINAVGTSYPGARELDTAAVQRARMFVDLCEGAIAQAGEFGLAQAEGAIDESYVLGEIGQVALGQIEGRADEHDITLYKSLGLVVQDLAAAHYIYEKARERGVGVVADF